MMFPKTSMINRVICRGLCVGNTNQYEFLQFSPDMHKKKPVAETSVFYARE